MNRGTRGGGASSSQTVSTVRQVKEYGAPTTGNKSHRALALQAKAGRRREKAEQEKSRWGISHCAFLSRTHAKVLGMTRQDIRSWTWGSRESHRWFIKMNWEPIREGWTHPGLSSELKVHHDICHGSLSVRVTHEQKRKRESILWPQKWREYCGREKKIAHQFIHFWGWAVVKETLLTQSTTSLITRNYRGPELSTLDNIQLTQPHMAKFGQGLNTKGKFIFNHTRHDHSKARVISNAFVGSVNFLFIYTTSRYS